KRGDRSRSGVHARAWRQLDLHAHADCTSPRSMWFESSFRWRARLTLRALRSTWRDASAAEDRWLLRHVSENARSAFGLAHRFRQVRSISDFQRDVPVRSLAEAQRATADLRRGLQRGLTVRPPFCLAVS